MLDLKSLVCGYLGHGLLAPIDRSVKAGQIIFLIGKNGAGKTTLMKTLAGLIAPVEGTLTSKSRPVFLPAQVSVADTLTGLDIHEIYGAGKPPLNWSVPRDRPFALLSSGEQRQILINATLSHSSQIVLLDEPFNFLDWNHTLELIESITLQAKGGRTFILATHHLDWILRFSETETWAYIDTPEKNTRELLIGETKSILLSERFQAAFGLRIQLLKNPSGDGHTLAVSKPD